jgi:hypothetical protein
VNRHGRQAPGAELPRAVDFLEMYSMLAGKLTRIGDLRIASNWKNSMMPENQEWLQAPIRAGQQPGCSLVFSTKADGDGCTA